MERSMDELVEAMGRAAHLREQVIGKLNMQDHSHQRL